MSAQTPVLVDERPDRSSTALWLTGTAAAVALWFAAYARLEPLSQWIVGHLSLEPGSHLEESVTFFAYDTPKVLMLLTLVVFVMGMVRSFFSPERTRALLAGRREGIGNIASAGLGISRRSAPARPCRCSSGLSRRVCPWALRFRF